MKNSQNNTDIANHKQIDIDLDKLVIKALSGKEVIDTLVLEEKEIRKKKYVSTLKSLIKEGRLLEKEVKQLRSNPDRPEEINPETGQVVKEQAISKSLYEKIKVKTNRINIIVNIIEDIKKNQYSLLEKEIKKDEQ